MRSRVRIQEPLTPWLENQDQAGGSPAGVPGFGPIAASATPPQGQGQQAPPTPQQAAFPFGQQPQPAVAPPQAPPTPSTVTLPADEAVRLYGLAAQLQQREAAAAAEAERLRNEALVAQAKKGEVDQAFDAFRKQADERYQGLERQLLDGERARLVAATLSKSRAAIRPECLPLVEDLISRGLVAVRDQSGNVHVQDATTGRPAADVINERLASAPFQVFYVPSTQGGAGARGVATTTPTPAANGDGPSSLGEALLAQWQSRQPTSQLFPNALGRR